MTREEALKILRYEMQTHIASEVELHIAMGMAIEALSADCISRQAVLSILNGFDVMDGHTDQQRAIRMVELLPSAIGV